jgi:hypothetical protein
LTDEFASVIDAIATHSTYLDLFQCFLTATKFYFAWLAPRLEDTSSFTCFVFEGRLQRLDLSFNNLGDNAAVALARAIAANQSLQWLRVTSNKFSDTAAEQLAQVADLL